ncbi:hypothetical protein JCM13591A_00240 [Microbacterium xylanilyticum]
MSRDLLLAQEALPVETIPQRFEAFIWFLRRRPTAPLTILTSATLFAPFIALSSASSSMHASWPAMVLLALAAVVSSWVAVIVVLGLAYFGIAAHPSVTRWATKDARIGIWVRQQGKKPGWYAAEHVARPGAAGAGRGIRLLLSDALQDLGDRQGVTLYAAHSASATTRAIGNAACSPLLTAGRPKCSALPGVSATSRQVPSIATRRRPARNAPTARTSQACASCAGRAGDESTLSGRHAASGRRLTLARR